jgi:serine phosphatase RsbU (regulator of sigma subunit)
MGKTIFSRVCSGDWWHFEKIGDYTLIVVGKVESRGLTAAMMTAVVRGALSTFVATTKILPQNMAPIFKLLVNHLNSAIYDCTRGKEKMRCFVGVMDLQSGKLTGHNFGFTPPLLHRLSFGGRPNHYDNRFSRIDADKGIPLGSELNIDSTPVVTQLSPGDMLFWYSPKILETANATQTTLQLSDLFMALGKGWDEYGSQSEKVLEKAMAKVTTFLGEVTETPPDDMTLMVACVPKNAYFIDIPSEERAKKTA